MKNYLCLEGNKIELTAEKFNKGVRRLAVSLIEDAKGYHHGYNEKQNRSRNCHSHYSFFLCH